MDRKSKKKEKTKSKTNTSSDNKHNSDSSSKQKSKISSHKPSKNDPSSNIDNSSSSNINNSNKKKDKKKKGNRSNTKESKVNEIFPTWNSEGNIPDDAITLIQGSSPDVHARPQKFFKEHPKIQESLAQLRVPPKICHALLRERKKQIVFENCAKLQDMFGSQGVTNEPKEEPKEEPMEEPKEDPKEEPKEDPKEEEDATTASQEKGNDRIRDSGNINRGNGADEGAVAAIRDFLASSGCVTNASTTEKHKSASTLMNLMERPWLLGSLAHDYQTSTTNLAFFMVGRSNIEEAISNVQNGRQDLNEKKQELRLAQIAIDLAPKDRLTSYRLRVRTRVLKTVNIEMTKSAEAGENRLYSDLDAAKIKYDTEKEQYDDQVKRNAPKDEWLCPDARLKTPIELHGKKIHWIDAKSALHIPDLTPQSVMDNLHAQMAKYTDKIGPGAILWCKGGFANTIKDLNPDVLHFYVSVSKKKKPTSSSKPTQPLSIDSTQSISNRSGSHPTRISSSVTISAALSRALWFNSLLESDEYDENLTDYVMNQHQNRHQQTRQWMPCGGGDMLGRNEDMHPAFYNCVDPPNKEDLLFGDDVDVRVRLSTKKDARFKLPSHATLRDLLNHIHYCSREPKYHLKIAGRSKFLEPKDFDTRLVDLDLHRSLIHQARWGG